MFNILRVLVCRPGWPGAHYASLDLTEIYQSLPPQYAVIKGIKGEHNPAWTVLLFVF